MSSSNILYISSIVFFGIFIFGKSETCGCNGPMEIVLQDGEYNYDICPGANCSRYSSTYQYCVPSNCTWKIIKNYTDPNLVFTYYLHGLQLRENRTDYIDIILPNNKLYKRYTWLDNSYRESDLYNMLEVDYFYVNFVADNSTTDKYDFNNNFDVSVQVKYKECSCGPTSTRTIYGYSGSVSPTNTVFDYIPMYCVPMKCSYSFINSLDNYYINVTSAFSSSSNLNLRNGSNDYIEISGKSGFSKRITYLDNGKISLFNITDKEFNVTFATGDPEPTGYDPVPYFSLNLVPTYNGPPTTTVEPVRTTPGPLCSCMQPLEIHLSTLLQGADLHPTYFWNNTYCPAMSCTWKVFNDQPYENSQINIAEWDYFRPNANDSLTFKLPSGEKLLTLSYMTDDDCTPDKIDSCSNFNSYTINAKEFEIEFVSDSSGTHGEATQGYFEISMRGTISSCSCEDHLPINYISDEKINKRFGYSSSVGYCPQMDCSWKFINGLSHDSDLWIYQDIGEFGLRNTTDDYVEAVAENGTVLFKMDGTNWWTYAGQLIQERSFNIHFHSGKFDPSSEALAPYWRLGITKYPGPTSTPQTILDQSTSSGASKAVQMTSTSKKTDGPTSTLATTTNKGVISTLSTRLPIVSTDSSTTKSTHKVSTSTPTTTIKPSTMSSTVSRFPSSTIVPSTPKPSLPASSTLIASTSVPITTKATTKVPTTTRASTAVPSTAKATTKVPTTTRASTAVPSTAKASTKVPTTTRASTAVPSTAKASTQAPSKSSTLKSTTLLATSATESSTLSSSKTSTSTNKPSTIATATQPLPTSSIVSKFSTTNAYPPTTPLPQPIESMDIAINTQYYVANPSFMRPSDVDAYIDTTARDAVNMFLTNRSADLSSGAIQVNVYTYGVGTSDPIVLPKDVKMAIELFNQAISKPTTSKSNPNQTSFVEKYQHYLTDTNKAIKASLLFFAPKNNAYDPSNPKALTSDINGTGKVLRQMQQMPTLYQMRVVVTNLTSQDMQDYGLQNTPNSQIQQSDNATAIAGGISGQFVPPSNPSTTIIVSSHPTPGPTSGISRISMAHVLLALAGILFCKNL